MAPYFTVLLLKYSGNSPEKRITKSMTFHRKGQASPDPGPQQHPGPQRRFREPLYKQPRLRQVRDCLRGLLKHGSSVFSKHFLEKYPSFVTLTHSPNYSGGRGRRVS
jgi:hypothetical protein